MKIPEEVKAVAYPITPLFQEAKQKYSLEILQRMCEVATTKHFQGETLIKCINSKNEEITQNYEMIILIIIFLERIKLINKSKRPNSDYSIKHAIEHWLRSDVGFYMRSKYVDNSLVALAVQILGIEHKKLPRGQIALNISKRCKFYNYYSDYQNF